MRIAIAGGGPGGLYLSILLKRLDPAHEVVVYERNAPDDTFGFGVVFSDETLTAFEAADPESYEEITRRFVRWSEIDVHYRGEVITSGGHGFSALGRKQLLHILQTRAAELGVELHFRHEVAALEGDLVVAADGVNSTLRGDRFGTTLDRRRATYAWFGTPHVFDAFTFLIAETERGVVQVHAYPYSDAMSTFIVETTDALPLDKAECEALFGYELVENRTRWINFVTVRNERWRDGNTVLLGDSAHTAHFSIGSGTKLAMEDAISLAWAVREGDIDAYEAERRPIVESTQRAAQGSLEWFEGIGRYTHQDARTFAFNLLTRSRRITHGELRMRDPDFVASLCDSPPMFAPLQLRSLELANRVVVSPMDMYSSVDGTPGDFHLVHLGARAIGGAGLVMTEMICTSADGRITPGCGGLYADEHTAAWKRIVDFVHTHSRAAIGCAAGPRRAQGLDAAAVGGRGPAAPGRQLAADRAFAAAVSAGRLAGAARDDPGRHGRRAGRLRGLHRARGGRGLRPARDPHGPRLPASSSFLSPLTNVRADEYGSDRAKYPLEVFAACRAVWPTDEADERAHQRHRLGPGRLRRRRRGRVRAPPGRGRLRHRRRLDRAGLTRPEARLRAFSYQTPYADRIRHEAGIPVIAVGAISSYDDVNTIILAGRADLCALARPHLWDPHWTLHAAADQGVDMHWIPQYRSGSREPNTGKDVRRMPLRRFETEVPA